MLFPHMSKDLSKAAIRGVILWLSKAVTHTCPVGEPLVSPEEKVTLWRALSDILGAVAGGRTGCAQGNVALVLFEALGGISSGTEPWWGGVDQPAGLTRPNSFEMHPPPPP